MQWLKELLGTGRYMGRWWKRPTRRVYVRKNKTPLGDYYGCVLYENNRHIHTIGMEEYDQERVNELRESWVNKRTYR